MPTEYTVTGLIMEDTGELLVSGVYEGHLENVDDEGYSGAKYQRYATTVHADDPAEAEVLAHLQHEHGGFITDITASCLKAGNVLVYDDGQAAVIADVGEEDDDTVLLWFVDQEDDEPASYDRSAALRVIAA